MEERERKGKSLSRAKIRKSSLQLQPSQGATTSIGMPSGISATAPHVPRQSGNLIEFCIWKEWVGRENELGLWMLWQANNATICGWAQKEHELQLKKHANYKLPLPLCLFLACLLPVSLPPHCTCCCSPYFTLLHLQQRSALCQIQFAPETTKQKKAGRRRSLQ